jgi:hypothetical protein
MSEADSYFDRWAASRVSAFRVALGARAWGTNREGYRVSAAPCGEHGRGCARVVYGMLADTSPGR